MRRVLIALAALALAGVFVGTGAPRASGADLSPSASSKAARLASQVRTTRQVGTTSAAPKLTTAAASNSVFQNDPTGDVQPSQDGRADITDFGVTYGPSSVTALIDVAQGTDPTSANWAGDTGAAWTFDTNADSNADFVVLLFQNPDDGRPLGGIFDVTNNTVPCLAMVTWDGNNRYRASFDPACIGSPASASVVASFAYDTTPADSTDAPFTDDAPDQPAEGAAVFAGPIVAPGSNGWNPFEFLGEPQGGFAAAAPDAASWSPGRVDSFERGNDGQLWHVFSDGSWNAEPMGGQLAPGTGPGVAAWGPGRLDVFVTGTDNQLWHAWFDGQWKGFEPLGGVLVGGPDVAAWSAGRLDVFVRGTDNRLWHTWYDNGWHGYEPLGGVLSSDPTAAAWSAGHLDVFVRGADNQLWHTWYDNGWHGYDPLGGVLSGAPDAASWAAGRLDVFARGTDSQLWHRFYASGWSAWEPLGGALASDPTAASWGSGRLDVFAISGDAALWHTWHP